MHNRRRKAAPTLLGIILLCGGEETLAQPKPKISSEDLQKAKTRFAEAEGFYRIGDYAAALEAYKEAYILSKKPGILFNMAQCYRYLKNYREASKTYQLYLIDDPKSDFRDEVELRLKELEVLIANEPSPSATLPSEPTTSPTKQPIDVRPGTQLVTAPPTSYVSRSDTQPVVDEGYQGPSGVVFIAGASVGGALGLLLGGVALSRANDAQSLQQEPISDPTDPRIGEAIQTYETAQRLGIASDLLLLSSVMLAGAGVYFSWKEKDAEKTAAALSISRGAVSVRVRF